MSDTGHVHTEHVNCQLTHAHGAVNLDWSNACCAEAAARCELCAKLWHFCVADVSSIFVQAERTANEAAEEAAFRAAQMTRLAEEVCL